MRRAAFVLGLFCVSAITAPVALRAAADTDSRAGALIVKTKTDAAFLPPAANTPPGSATPSILHRRLQQADPHPLITQFYGPALPKTTAKPPAPARTPAPRAAQ